jgi:hypothetical protein
MGNETGSKTFKEGETVSRMIGTSEMDVESKAYLRLELRR